MVLIKDLGSTNGTLVNRALVKEAVLQPGQTIHLGAVELHFLADAPSPVPPARTTVMPTPPRSARGDPHYQSTAAKPRIRGASTRSTHGRARADPDYGLVALANCRFSRSTGPGGARADPYRHAAATQLSFPGCGCA
jgi:hypothetical protein